MRSSLRLTRSVNQAGHFHSAHCIAGAVKADGCCLNLEAAKRTIRKSSTRFPVGKARRSVEAFRHFDMITSESSSVGEISPCRDWWRLRYRAPSPSTVLLVLSGTFEYRLSRDCRRFEATQVPGQVFRQAEVDFASCARRQMWAVFSRLLTHARRSTTAGLCRKVDRYFWCSGPP